jgi:hypothetical protein
MNNSTDLVDRYIAIWNEPDAGRRRELIVDTWAEDGRYIDPLFAVGGHDGVETMVSGFQQQFPGLTFARTGDVEQHHDRVRFTWDLLPPTGGRIAAGTDVAIVSPDGRLADVAGFFDQAPVLPDAALEGATA